MNFKLFKQPAQSRIVCSFFCWYIKITWTDKVGRKGFKKLKTQQSKKLKSCFFVKLVKTMNKGSANLQSAYSVTCFKATRNNKIQLNTELLFFTTQRETSQDISRKSIKDSIAFIKWFNPRVLHPQQTENYKGGKDVYDITVQRSGRQRITLLSCLSTLIDLLLFS